jgi:hypothetical protein
MIGADATRSTGSAFDGLIRHINRFRRCDRANAACRGDADLAFALLFSRSVAAVSGNAMDRVVTPRASVRASRSACRPVRNAERLKLAAFILLLRARSSRSYSFGGEN